MARPVSASQQTAAWTVLVLLALVAAWLGWTQARFNPAVVAALNPPPPAGAIQDGDGVAAFASAALIPDIPGLTPAGPIESYGPETLSDKIDGKAELYLASGFREMSCRAFKTESGAPFRLEVFVFEMTEPKAAFAVFTGQRRQGSTDAAVPGLAEGGGRAYGTGNALFLALGARYVEIVADREGPDVTAVLDAAARAVLERLGPGLPEATPPGAPPAQPATDPSGLFPPEGQTPGSVRLAMNDALGMEGFREVYTAEFRTSADGANGAGGAGEATAFLAERDSPEAATAQATAYADFLRALGYAPSSKSAISADGLPAGTIILEQAGDVRTVFAVGRRLGGVFDATSPETALELSRSLAARLEQAP